MLNQKLIFISVCLLIFSSCTYDKKELPVPLPETGYPDEIGKIISNRCAAAGCHNTQSKEGAAGLDLSTWDKLFEGSRSGAVIIPYRADQSTLLYFINTDTLLGVTQAPTMPNNGTPLSKDDYLLIKNWVDSGAPDRNGFVKFSDNPLRKKIYVPNQGCDIVAVVDAETKLVMRYVNVGSLPNKTESPHMIKVTPDNKYWCVSYLAGTKFQKYNVNDNSLAGETEIGVGQWNTFALSPGGDTAYAIDFSPAGQLAIINLQTMTLVGGMLYTDILFSSPHGSAVSPDGNFLYVTQQLNDGLYKWNLTGVPEMFLMNFNSGTITQSHEIAFSPDGLKYFVTCQATDEVKVFNALNDQLITSVPTADYPQEMSFSRTTNYLFVSCMGNNNAVTVIDYLSLTKIKDIFTGYTPHGVSVDDTHNCVFITNRNLLTSGGPIPHHTSVCGGRNGYMTAIDLNTLELIQNYKHELSVDPYGLGITH